MLTLIAVFGFMMILLSGWGILAPNALTARVVNVWNRPWGLLFAVAVRVFLGALFVFAAGETRYPMAFQILGWVMLLAALLIVVSGRKRMDQLIDYFQRQPPLLIRLLLLLGIAFGAFVIYAVR